VKSIAPQELLDRKPPSDAAIERAFLGAVMLQPDVIQTVDVRPGDFYLQEHQVLFETITTMYGGGEAVDMATLTSNLKVATANDESAFEMVGGAIGLAKIFESVPTARNATSYGERIKKLSESRRFLNLGVEIIQGVHAGKSHDELLLQIQDACDTVTRTSLEFDAITCADLEAADYNTEFLIENTLVARQPCIVAGGKKSLKTSIMIDLAITRATGGFFLGRLRATRPARILIMSGESGQGTIQETARRIANAAGRRLEDVTNLYWSFQLPKFGNLEHMGALTRLLKAKQPEVLILDPAYLAMPAADAANLMAQGELLRGVSDVCQESGAMLILAHHTKKTGKTNPHSKT